MPLHLPNGNDAENMDFIMLLSIWTRELNAKAACMGHPTFPVYPKILEAAKGYWAAISHASGEARHSLSCKPIDKITLHDIPKYDAAIDYGHPQGDVKLREVLAESLTTQYKVPITAENILFTVGGAGGLRLAFNIINAENPGGLIVTSFPHYPLYSQAPNNLFPIHRFKGNGFRLTVDMVADGLKCASEVARKKGTVVSGFILCNPHNPTGDVIDETELRKIAQVLRSFQKENPHFKIICDEAYAKLTFNGQFCSLLTVAPELNVIVSISGTKTHSVSGERMAILVAQDKATMGKLLDNSIFVSGHVPRSIQVGFTAGLVGINEDLIEQKIIREYYHQIVKYAQRQVKNLAIDISGHEVLGAFYIMVDLSEFIGLPITPEAKRALGEKKEIIETDLDICFHLLFHPGIKSALSPLSPFGLDPRAGLMRITCSNYNTLKEMFSCLERELVNVRELNQERFKDQIYQFRQKLTDINMPMVSDIDNKMTKIHLLKAQTKALRLKDQNLALHALLRKARKCLPEYKEREKQGKSLGQSIAKALRQSKQLSDILDKEWQKCVDQCTSSAELQQVFFKLPVGKRQKFFPWQQHLSQLAGNQSNYNDENGATLHSRL